MRKSADGGNIEVSSDNIGSYITSTVVRVTTGPKYAYIFIP